jgi:hypothetical protein
MHREGSEEGQIKERADLLALPFDFPLRFSGVLQWSRPLWTFLVAACLLQSAGGWRNRN